MLNQDSLFLPFTFCLFTLPRAFGYAWDQAAMRHTTEANAADAESAHIAARTSAQIAAVLHTRLEYDVGVLALGFCDLACLRH